MSRGEAAAGTAAVPQVIDPFPKAPVVPFPVESASPAITSVVNLLVASGVASVLLGADRSVKFVSEEAKKLFDTAELPTLKVVESLAGIRVADLGVPASAGTRILNRNYIWSLVPISGGVGGAVLVFRAVDPVNESHASFITYVRETVFSPLTSLKQSLTAASNSRNADPLLADAAATVEQILSSLELAPGIHAPAASARPVPTVTDVVRRIADRYVPFADLKGIRLEVDAQELEERFNDREQLGDALAILMENALHYVPSGGQVVIGVRWMEHKGKPLLLFFVIDNGPLVPEQLRQTIFEPDFAWSPSSSERSGRALFKCREFAVSHGGSVWVESKTGKACTFFLRVRPDGAR
ncbi:MAG TPA: HAMP domain-containing sensor histidine kinase [Thermoanaerobaculia bacterium]|nr:HAMP domain-containing sensor histidine kinase [Thermoanaerobaculia bacterium]